MPEATETGEGRRAAQPLLIHLWVRSVEPVAGRIALDGRRPAAFEGWLHLLQRLSELVASSPGAKHRPISDCGSSPRAALRHRDLRAFTERTDRGVGARQFIPEERKEGT
jgi:hypothetical protein